MKKLKNLLRFLLAGVVLVGMFAACEGPAGPKGDKGDAGDPGPKGDPGDSYVNWEGYATGIKCANCHDGDTDSLFHVQGRVAQYSMSKHGSGSAYTENAGRCAYCHTTEAFIQINLGKMPTDQPNGSRPGCFACHSPHSRADFSLRTTEPVTLIAGVVGEPDQTFDYGKGNLCANCHRPRDPQYGSSNINPKPDPTKTAITDTIVINTSRWYQHYGVQAPMLAGYNGFEFQGYTYSNSPHTGSSVIKEEGCVICHMAEDVETTLGGHTMNLADGEGGELTVGCLTSGCHSEPFELNYDGVQTEIQGLLDSLATLLLDREWIYETSSGYSTNAGSGTPRNGKLYIAPAYLSGAMYNFFFVEHDLSLGVHNTKYARQLLQSSIEVLTAD
jgi:hypothetical protein